MPEEKKASPEEKKRVRFRDDDNDGSPIIFSSLADMMETAGTLPSPSEAKSSTTGSSTPPRVVEAHLSFSCMTEEEYERRLDLSNVDELEKEIAYCSDDGDDDDDHDNANHLLPTTTDDDKEEDNDSGDDEGSFLNFADLIGIEEEEDSDGEDVVPRQPSAFLLLWHVLLELCTPQAADFLKLLHESNATNDTVAAAAIIPDTDITAARCAGLLAMLKMYLTRALRDLSLPKEDFRNAEQRLSSLLGTFQYARPVAQLEVAHWRAMTCILVQMVMTKDSAATTTTTTTTTTTKLPKSVKDIGLTQEEYQFLVQKSIFTLNSRITEDSVDED